MLFLNQGIFFIAFNLGNRAITINDLTHENRKTFI